MKKLGVLFIVWLFTMMGCVYGRAQNTLSTESITKGKMTETKIKEEKKIDVKGFFPVGDPLNPPVYVGGGYNGSYGFVGNPRVTCVPAVQYGPQGAVNTTKCFPTW